MFTKLLLTATSLLATAPVLADDHIDIDSVIPKECLMMTASYKAANQDGSTAFDHTEEVVNSLHSDWTPYSYAYCTSGEGFLTSV